MILKVKTLYNGESQTSDSKFRSTAFCKEEASDRASSILVSSLLNFFAFVLLLIWTPPVWEQRPLSLVDSHWLKKEPKWSFSFQVQKSEKTKWKVEGGAPIETSRFCLQPCQNILVYVKISLSLPFVFVLSLLVGKCFLACLQLLSLCLSCPHSYKHDDDIQGW